MADVQAAAAREVPENSDSGTFVGGPVTATDDNGDTLTYTLWDGVDGGTTGHSASFSIDRATGQIKTKVDLDKETEDVYEVWVRATDPAGMPKAASPVAGNSGTVQVDITVTDVDEAPVITGDAAVSFHELTGTIDDVLGNNNSAYMATDQDVAGDGETKEVNTATWATAGPDGSKFTATGGQLKFKAQPDYEKPADANKDNVYEVTVTVADERGERGMRKVKVTVTDADEPGVVTLSKTQPRVGIPITASLSDPDGSLTAVSWQWSTSGSDILGATTDTYKPDAEDVGTLTATARYFDGHSAPDADDGAKKTAFKVSANAVAVDTRNKAPAFEDQDDDIENGVQNESTTRKVDENTKADAADDVANAADAVDAADNVGGVVTATDPDPNGETPQYSLSGPEAMYFRVRDNGQIEVGASAKLDYETKPPTW